MEFFHFRLIGGITNIMLKNHLKTGWRNILRNKSYAIVNILGLSLGISACLVIHFVASYEFSFDTFHPGRERIYRVMADITERSGGKLHSARIPAAVSQMARSTISGLEAVAGYIPYNPKITIPDDYKQFEGRNTTVIAEPSYFTIFKYEWLAGNAATALSSPFSVVLTESRARDYFGPTSADKYIGKQVIYEDSLSAAVTGIVKDLDKNSDLAFTDFLSYPTIQSSFLRSSIDLASWHQRDLAAWTFVRLKPGTTPARIDIQMAGLVQQHGDPQTRLTLWLEPLSDMHFNGDVIENPIRTAHRPTLYGLMTIALFILILAMINFINLSTAQSIRRAREIGVRKVLGSGRSSIVLQFLIETTVLTSFATLLGLLLVRPALYFFRSFVPEGVTLHFFSPATLLIFLTVTFVTAVLAGLYPAKVLSSYNPAVNLQSAGEYKGGNQWLLRKGLIVFQFTVSLVFIIGSIVIAEQLRYAQDKNPGFNADAILTVQSPWGDSLSKVRVLAEKLKKIPGIQQVALQWVSPMTENTRGLGLKLRPADTKELGAAQVVGNEDFISLYQIRLLAGRNLHPSDSVRELVINERLSQLIGDTLPAQSIGKTLYWRDRPYPVVGVVADFHTSSLHDPLSPLCILNRTERESAIAIKLASKGKNSHLITTTLSQTEKAWKQVYPDKGFNYKFYDESLALLYKKDRQTALLINSAMTIAILISCIGLFGLALFSAERKAKEISIRKILGATVESITFLLCKDFVQLVLLALLVASPIAWYLMDRWLHGFAYHIRLQAWIFVTTGAAAIGIALITVGYQSVRAAMVNPIKNLNTT